MADLTSMWPSWGSQGSQPSDGKQHGAGDNPKADAYNHLWYQLNQTFDSVETWVSANESDISNLQSNKLDASNYTPVSDVDGEVSSAAATVSGLDSQVDTNVTDISSLDSNKLDASNYTPVSDVDSEVSQSASTVSEMDSQVDTNVTDISDLQTGSQNIAYNIVY